MEWVCMRMAFRSRETHLHMKKILFVLPLLIFLGARLAQALPVGASAPVLEGVDQDGKKLNLGDFYKKGFVLVYFYPKADTPGCTAQACSLRDAYADLAKEGVTVIGVSHDSPAAQKLFQDKYHLPFELIADQDGAFAKAFGVPITGGFEKRQAFLIRNGKVVWADFAASTDQQAADVKKAIHDLPPQR
jgi:thioredoxin-dependent peroxiredoxin